MKNIEYRDILEAMDILGLPNMITRDDLKQRYRELAKRYHPDRVDGNSKEMDRIIRAYELLLEYIDGFKFSFDEDEFKKRYPHYHHNQKFRI